MLNKIVVGVVFLNENAKKIVNQLESTHYKMKYKVKLNRKS